MDKKSLFNHKGGREKKCFIPLFPTSLPFPFFGIPSPPLFVHKLTSSPPSTLLLFSLSFSSASSLHFSPSHSLSFFSPSFFFSLPSFLSLLSFSSSLHSGVKFSLSLTQGCSKKKRRRSREAKEKSSFHLSVCISLCLSPFSPSSIHPLISATWTLLTTTLTSHPHPRQMKNH